MIIKTSKKETIKECLEENNFSRKVIRSLDFCYVDNKEFRLWMTVEKDTLVDVPIKKEESDVIPTKGDIDIVYEDNDLLIVNKKNKMSTQPNIGHYTDSLSNYIKYYFDSNNIDKSTYNLSYESRSNEDDINYVKENYYSSINANSNAYGNRKICLKI